MAATQFCADWSNLGDDKFQEIIVHEKLKWAPGAKKRLGNQANLTAMGQFAGPIAIAFRQNEYDIHFPIKIYQAHGEELATIEWNGTKLIAIGWTACEHLLCVCEDARILMFTIFGERLRHKNGETSSFNMGKEATESGVVAARIFHGFGGNTGLAVLTRHHRIFLVNNVHLPSVWRTPELQRKAEAPSCWTVLNSERSTRVVLAIKEDIYFLSQGNAEKILPPTGTLVDCYADVALSADRKRLAFLSDTYQLQIFTSDLRTCILDTRELRQLSGLPSYFLWSGSDAVACIIDDNHTLLLHSITDDSTLIYSYSDGPVVTATSECDALRIVTSKRHSLVGKVSKAAVDVLEIAGGSPGNLLLAAYEAYQRGQPTAYDSLVSLSKTGKLESAVQQCIEAACNQWNPVGQKLLLYAASMGRVHSGSCEPDAMCIAAKTLRIINQIRNHLIALPISYPQYTRLTIDVLVDRLLYRRHYPLAIAISIEMKIPNASSKILLHWANYQMEVKAADSTPQTLAAVIMSKIGLYSNAVAYADVALCAARLEQRELASLLLEKETCVKRRVCMLLELERYGQALQCAADSNDPDIIYYAIVELKRSSEGRRKGDLELLLRQVPAAYSLYKAMLREQHTPQHILALYKKEDDFQAQAIHALSEADAAGPFEIRERIERLRAAADRLHDAKDLIGSALARDAAALTELHSNLEAEFGQEFVSKSPRETIEWLIANGHEKRADQVKKHLNISDRLYAHWKVQALAAAHQWQQLEQLSKQRRPPCSMLTFVEACLAAGNQAQARKYAERCDDDRVKLLII